MDAWRWAYRGQLPDAVLDGLSVDGLRRDWAHLLGPDNDGFVAWVAELDSHAVGFAGSGSPRDDDAPTGAFELLMSYLLEDAPLGSSTLGRAFYERHARPPDGQRREFEVDDRGYPELRCRKLLVAPT